MFHQHTHTQVKKAQLFEYTQHEMLVVPNMHSFGFYFSLRCVTDIPSPNPTLNIKKPKKPAGSISLARVSRISL